MAKVKFNRALIEKDLNIEKNIDKINLFGTTIESLTEKELELEIPANRPDLLSRTGFIRAWRAFSEKESGLKEYPLKSSQYQVIVNKSVKSVRPFTRCAVIKVLSLTQEIIKEIMDVQEKLHNTIGRNRKKAAIGIYPLDKIKFPITYQSLKPSDIKFIPLESNKEMSASEILERHPAGKLYSHLLSSHTNYPIFMDANKKILSMPPIINSEETGRVTINTKEIFIECSGHNVETLETIISILSSMFSDLGGTIYSVEIIDDKKIKSPDFTPIKTKLNREYAEKILGIKLDEKQISHLLARMGHNYSKGLVQSPSWRADILHPIDLIEDIIIAYGYDKIVPIMPAISTVASETRESRVNRLIINSLVGLGFLETSSLHFITSEEAEKQSQENSKNKIEIQNPRTDYSILRPDLLTPTLRTLTSNIRAEYPQLCCEIGTVFKKSTQNPQITEHEHLIITQTPANFTSIKQTLDYLFRNLNLQYELKPTPSNSFITGRAGSIIVNKTHIGHIGEIHPNTLNDWHLRFPLAVAELNLEEIYKLLE